jgi:hypothetical protein
MTYAIRRENGDVLYFDAITSIQEQYSATVTKHPLARGAFVSDHTIVDNIKFTLNAILSDADFNLNRPFEEGWQSVTNKQFVNNTRTSIPVKISNEGAKWRSFLPEVVSQFTANTIPTVTVTAQSKVKTAKAVRSDLLDIFDKKEAFTLVEYNTNLVSRLWANVILTSITFTEDADSGTGLFPMMGMEQVTYTNVEFADIKLKTVPNKGRKVGETTKTEEKPGDDAQNEKTDNATKTSAAKVLKTGTASQ